MRNSLNAIVALLWVAAAPGCIIGTWPTPEDQGSKTGATTPGTLATEECDGNDNDGDGAVDEGCPCDAEARGCIGVGQNMCGPGIQWCSDGVWQGCTDIGAPNTAPRAPKVSIFSVSPAALHRGSVETVTVAIEPVTVCAGVVVDHVDVTLSAATPVMRIRATAYDDGVAPDAIRGDGIYTVSLVSPFGPGVPAQTLKVSGVAVIDRVERTGSVSLPLVDP